MRFGLTLMLTLSVALHLGLALGLTLSHYRATPPGQIMGSEGRMTQLILLKPTDVPKGKPIPPAAIESGHLVKNTPAEPIEKPPIREAAPLPAKKPLPPAPPLVAHSQGQLRSPSPDELLSPAQAPHLDGHNGVVFLLDISGSMYEPYEGTNRMALAREALAQCIRALKDGTPFSVILYAERSKRSGPLVAASDATREAAVSFIQRDVYCGGGTNLPDGLAWAMQLQAGNFVVVSDGDLNMSPTELLTKTNALMGPKGRSPQLNVVAICPRADTQDKLLLQSLASQQGGTFQEAQFDLLTSNPSSIGTP